MANWNNPTLTTNADTCLDELMARDTDAMTAGYTSPTNPPTRALRYDRGTTQWQEWSGTAWVDKGSLVSPSVVLGTMAVQASNNVAINGGVIEPPCVVEPECIGITPGLVYPNALGSGVAAAYSILHGDQVWRSAPPIGSTVLWFTAVPPTYWGICNGQSLLRATYVDLFTLIGTTFGAVDGTHFSLPDLRGFFPFGKAASGSGSTLGTTFGAIDHTHTTPLLAHTVLAHSGVTKLAPQFVDGSDVSDHAAGVSGSNNPPGFPLNFIMKIL